MSATLERGFKSWAERTAMALRQELGLEMRDALDPGSLAKSLEVRLRTPADIPSLPRQVLNQLLKVDADGWSAVTVCHEQDTVVIYNPTHSKARQASDIIHELAHIILGHEPARLIVLYDGQLVMRSYDPKQEDEANWLGWALLLPRDGLLHFKRLRASVPDIAEKYGVSHALVNYRLRLTGVEAQIRASSRYRR